MVKEMSDRHHDTLLRFVKLINLIMLTIPFAAAWMGYYADRTWAPYYAKGNYLIIALFLIIYATYGQIYEAFLVSVNRISEMVYSQGLAVLISDGIMYLVCWLLTKHLPRLWPLLLVFAVQLVLAGIWSVCAHHWYFYAFPPRRTGVIYDSRQGMEQLLEEYRLDVKFDVLCTASISECMENGMEILKQINTVFLCGIHSHDRNIILKYCVKHGITVYVIPRIGDVLMSGAKPVHMMHLPMLRVGRYNPPIEYLALKRFMDIFFSGLALILLSPIFLITSIAIKATDGGPVFYRQCRLTKNGKEFDVLKFRSMRVDAEKDGIARLSTGVKDDRVTPVGKFIRKCRLDELPQLINILKGEMTIVGPRPERPEIAEQYEKELPEFSLRLQAKAGLTGYAQVHGKYNTTPYDKLQMDLMYISKPSFWEDVRIIFATIKILFLPESTDGIKEGQTSAMESEEKQEKIIEIEKMGNIKDGTSSVSVESRSGMIGVGVGAK